MKCSIAQKKISAFIDGELPEEERESLSAHLKSCRSCRRMLDEFSSVFDSLDFLEDISAPPFFGTRVMRRIAEEGKGRLLPLSFVERVRRATLPAAAGVLLCVSILAGGSLGKGIYNLRAEKTSREEVELVEYIGGDSFSGLSYGSLMNAYDNLLTTGDE